MAIYRGSRYQDTLVYNYIDPITGNMTPTLTRREVSRKMANLKNISHKTYTWTDSSRIDLLAYNEYGDSSLWWAIMDANPQYLLPFDIQSGNILVIPPYEVIREVLGNA